MRAIAIVSIGTLAWTMRFFKLEAQRGASTHDYASQIHEHSGGGPGPGAENLYRKAGLQGCHRPGNGPRPALDRTSPGQGGKPAGAVHHGWRGRPRRDADALGAGLR